VVIAIYKEKEDLDMTCDDFIMLADISAGGSMKSDLLVDPLQ